MDKRINKAYVRYDKNGRIIPGGPRMNRFLPKSGGWKEVNAYECCNTPVISPSWNFVGVTELAFPTGPEGYTLYEGGWTQYDDGQTSDPLPYAGTFYTDGVGDTEFKVSTNGFMFGVINSLMISGNNGDLFLTPGAPLNDGDTQNLWYKNDVYPTKWKTSVLVYCGHCCGPLREATPYSYIINLYKDATNQYIETRVKTYDGGSAGPNTFNTQPSNILSQVWSTTDNTNWNYLGFGTVI